MNDLMDSICHNPLFFEAQCAPQQCASGRQNKGDESESSKSVSKPVLIFELSFLKLWFHHLAQPLLPNSHSPRQNRADSGTLKTQSQPNKGPRADGTPCTTINFHGLFTKHLACSQPNLGAARGGAES